MKKSLVFDYLEGNFSITVCTNHSFISGVKNGKDDTVSKFEQELSPFINVYYCKESEAIAVDVTKNNFFDKAWVSDFRYYFDSKDVFVRNASDETSISKQKFIELIKKEYKGYLEINEVINFDYGAYGVEQIPIGTQEMLAVTEIGDRWVNENGIAIEHTQEGIKWEATNLMFLNEINEEMMRSEVLSRKWTYKLGPNKECLVYFQYSWDEIKNWTEDECKIEIKKHKYWEQCDMNSWEEFCRKGVL